MWNRFYRGVLLDPDPVQAGGDAPNDGGLPDIVAPQTPKPDPRDLEMQQLKETVNRLVTAVQDRPQPVQQQPTRPAFDRTEAVKKFYEDPLGTLSGAMEFASQRAVQQTMQTMAPTMVDMARSRARESDPDLFDIFEPQIVARMNEMPPELRTNTTVWVNVFNTLKGENLDKVMQHKGQKQSQKTSNDGPITPSSKSQPVNTNKTKLTDEELVWAKKYKLSPEQYAQGKADYANQEAAWNRVMTFDSYEPVIERNKPRERR